jgi:hypothetical protein
MMTAVRWHLFPARQGQLIALTGLRQMWDQCLLEQLFGRPLGPGVGRQVRLKCC